MGISYFCESDIDLLRLKMADEGDDWNDRVFAAGMWSHSYVRRIYNMVISSKGEYALRVMADLAINHDGRFIPLKEIVQKEELSQKYLESIMRMLSKANLIEAASGHGGGYRLKKAPEEYTLWEILELTEGGLAPVACMKNSTMTCDRSEQCYTLPIWRGLAELIQDYFKSKTLADIARNVE